MPELPEVETTRRGVEPHVVGRQILSLDVRQANLRWPVALELPALLAGQQILRARRRAKYLLLDAERHTLMIHLGMSGSLRIMPVTSPPLFHDHVDIVLDDGNCLRYNDPRRFGSMHLLTSDDHPLLNHLGPEPLSSDFDGAWLHDRAGGRRAPVKQFLMDGQVVVGVGNIYANEALFMAGIHPARAAGRISLQRFVRLADAVKVLLSAAIEQGGTTLRDFVGSDGQPGYFAQQLNVYGRAGLACRQCTRTLRELRQSNRSSVYCPGCQR
ncbi:MAG: bifunctional DNA-formamidopyrimidine glycosylase/DNA-(apurinic or apyrimidinic site) lyase [Luminiphilus sp.]